MKQLANWTLAAAVCVVIYLMGEGVLAINQWERSHRSLTYRAAQMIDGISGRAEPRFYRPVLSDPKEIEDLLDDMHSAGVGLGNSPYEELRTTRASTARKVDGCLQYRPNLHKTFTYLRTPLFEMFNPVAMFYDSDRELSNRLQQFVERYGVRQTTFTSDQFGQRTTVPTVDRHDVVLIAGDSVAAGAGINDDETLASRLQRRDLNRRYVNFGKGGAEAAEIRCNIEHAAERFRNRVQELIYVYCENDFDNDESMGTPESVMTWLRQFVGDQEIERTTIVYAPYIFNVVPELTRVPGERGERFKDHADEKARLLALVRDAGFAWVDFGELALAEADARGTPFAALGLYVDVVHHSPLGVERLADALDVAKRSTTAERGAGLSLVASGGA